MGLVDPRDLLHLRVRFSKHAGLGHSLIAVGLLPLLSVSQAPSAG